MCGWLTARCARPDPTRLASKYLSENVEVYKKMHVHVEEPSPLVKGEVRSRRFHHLPAGFRSIDSRGTNPTRPSPTLRVGFVSKGLTMLLILLMSWTGAAGIDGCSRQHFHFHCYSRAPRRDGVSFDEGGGPIRPLTCPSCQGWPSPSDAS